MLYYQLLAILIYLVLRKFVDVGNLNKPILTIWGTEDEVVPFIGSKELMIYIPQSELLVLKEASMILLMLNLQ